MEQKKPHSLSIPPGSQCKTILTISLQGNFTNISFTKKNAKGELNYLFPSLELSFCGRCYDIGLYFIESKRLIGGNVTVSSYGQTVAHIITEALNVVDS